MTTSGPRAMDCNTVSERLIGGERPGSDPALAEHVGSCLRCFRTASDLRGLPQLRARLERGRQEGDGPDPGAAFWASFPAQVTAAWEATLAARAADVVPVVRRPGLIERGWETARAWFRLPVPAALGGAICAALLVVVVTRQLGSQKVAPVAGDAVAVSGARGGESTGAGELGDEAVDEDSMQGLNASGLAALRRQLEATLADEPPGRDTEALAESNPAVVADDLYELDAAGLAALARELGKGRI